MHELIELFRKELVEVALFAENTVGIYVTSVYRFFEYSENILSINPLKASPDQLNDWIIHLKNYDTSSSRLINYQVGIKRFFAFAEKIGIIKSNPAILMFPIRKEKIVTKQPVSSEDALKILDSFDRSSWIGMRDFMIVSFFWSLGLRISELVNLKIRDFDPDFDKPNRIGTLLIHGKGKKERSIFVVDRLYTCLIRYLNHPDFPEPSNKHRGKKWLPMFPTAKATPVSKNRIQRVVKETAIKHGITYRVTPHSFRHSFATEMYHKKVTVDAIRRIMGHDKIEETSLYIHVSEQVKKDALSLISIQGGKS